MGGPTIANALVRAFGPSGNGQGSGEDFYIPASSFSNSGTVRQVTSGTTDTATVADSVIAWNSATSGAKTQNILAGTFNGQTFTVVDEYGDAATNNIIITIIGGTINGAATYTINLNTQSITMKWNGNGNYIVV